MLGVTSASVSNWALRFRKGGTDELLAKPKGRPPGGIIRPEDTPTIQQILVTQGPDQVGLGASLWSWRAVQALLCRHGKTEVSRWTVIRYLKRWGFEPPTADSYIESRASLASKKELASQYAKIKSRAMQAGRIVYFVERCLFPTAAEIVDSDDGSPYYLNWALGPRGDAAFMVTTKTYWVDDLIHFFERLTDFLNGRRCVAIVDPGFQNESSVINWLEGNEDVIRLESLEASG